MHIVRNEDQKGAIKWEAKFSLLQDRPNSHYSEVTLWIFPESFLYMYNNIYGYLFYHKWKYTIHVVCIYYIFHHIIAYKIPGHLLNSYRVFHCMDAE